MKRSVLSISILAILLVAMVSSQTISTQGVLRDSDGHSVEDGEYTMSFSIFGDMEGGSALWGPHSQTVTVENGIYHVVLGADNAITSFDSDGSNYLELSVEQELMTPRLHLNVTPYELANLMGSSNALPGSGNVGIGTTNPQAKLAIVAPGDNVDLLQFDENSDSEKEFSFQGMFSGSGGTGNGLKVRSQWIDKIMFWRGDGKVGIGTTEPQQKLHVEGGIYANGYIGNKGTNSGQQMETGDAGMVTLRFDSDNYRIYAGGTGGNGQVVTITENGSMGISTGTAAPEVKLQVNGGSDVGPATGGFIQAGSSTGTNLAIDNNEIMARNNGVPAQMYLNAEGGDIQMGGDLEIKEEVRVLNGSTYEKPFQFERYSGSGEDLTISTSYSSSEWIAAVVGFDAGYGDLDEGGNNDLWQINCAVAANGNWEIFCDAPTHGNLPDWQIYVMFVSTKFGYATSNYKSH